jgi:hypothetical protein
MPLIALLLLAFAVTANAADDNGDANAYRSWLISQAQGARHSGTDAGAVIAIVWQHQQCERDAACNVRVTESDAAKLAHARTRRNPAMLALLAGAEDSALDSQRRADRWHELADLDVGNSYPLMALAGIHWQHNERSLALAALKQSIARPRFDDYYSAMFASVKQFLDEHPPSAAQLAPCALAGKGAPADMDATERSLAAIDDLFGEIAFTRLTDILGACKTTADPADYERRKLCGVLGAKMDALATTWLSQNVGLALRRFSTEDVDLQARYTRQQHDNLDDLQRSLWWFESAQSPVRREATTLWLKEFARAGELAGAAALRERYGDPPESREKREAHWQKRLAEGRACYSILGQAALSGAHSDASPTR